VNVKTIEETRGVRTS